MASLEDSRPRFVDSRLDREIRSRDSSPEGLIVRCTIERGASVPLKVLDKLRAGGYPSTLDARGLLDRGAAHTRGESQYVGPASGRGTSTAASVLPGGERRCALVTYTQQTQPQPEEPGGEDGSTVTPSRKQAMAVQAADMKQRVE
jgi:hypothetical protein